MLFTSLLALATEPVVPPPPDHAEYTRLSQELQSLAARNAWAGADRTFRALMATGAPPTFEDLVQGAHAARAIGDMGASRDRLVAAKAHQEDREVIDWLWEIDRNYSRVTLKCDVGSGWELASDNQPFNPDHLRAIHYAIDQVDTRCAFDGLLPAGSYQFAHRPFTVRPGVAGVDMDLRGLPPDKRALRAKKKAEKAAAKAAKQGA